MDATLLKERELFKKRALAQPAIEKRKASSKPSESEKKTKKSRPLPKPKADESSFNYKTSQGSSQNKFGVLTRIVKFMKIRHQRAETHPLTLEEILDETKQLDVGMRMRHWLSTEALGNNPKITVVDGNKYLFKPKFTIRDRRSLLKLLDKYDQRGLGGILMDDISESLPRCDRILKILGDQVLQVPRGADKKVVLFYNDKSFQFEADEELQKLWRSVPVDGIDEQKIEEYLEKQGINSMQDISSKKSVPIQKRKRLNTRKKSRPTKTHNDHLGDLLKDYSELTDKKSKCLLIQVLLMISVDLAAALKLSSPS
ncbi:general transcription factor IIE subunit 2-like [Tubulanus polymorphus]|uniref:general transcription factor IIE subunit 2-like n=1 Tax=Tubulanus polymorphus TaxID=672921 RepID=UPI003DA2CF61